MVGKIIPPRRDQPITGKNGLGTTRLLEYLEQTSEDINAVPTDIEEQIFALQGSVQKTGALTSELESQIDNIIQLVAMERARSSELESLVSDAVQLLPNFGTINSQLNEMQKRIEDLEQLQNGS